MKAILSREGSGPEGLEFSEVETPPCGPDEVLVQVKATAINRADLLQTLGMYPAPLGVHPDIPGLEFSGEIVARGDRVTRLKVGEPVMGLVAGAAWAEYVVLHERCAMRVPKGISVTDAAAIPEAFATAFDALILQARVQRGQTVLVHAAASGVGTAAVQLCQAYGARCFGTGRNKAKLKRLTGISTILLSEDTPSFSREIMSATHEQGVDIVIDLIGGHYFSETLASMAPKGTLMLVGLVAGAVTEIPLRTVLSKRLTITGTALRTRPLEEKIALAKAFEKMLTPLFESGDLKPVIDATSSIKEVAAALKKMQDNEGFGKHILTW
jgi:NADPH:quinone reductase